jgi:hypothetical protein
LKSTLGLVIKPKESSTGSRDAGGHGPPPTSPFETYTSDLFQTKVTLPNSRFWIRDIDFITKTEDARNIYTQFLVKNNGEVSIGTERCNNESILTVDGGADKGVTFVDLVANDNYWNAQLRFVNKDMSQVHLITSNPDQSMLIYPGWDGRGRDMLRIWGSVEVHKDLIVEGNIVSNGGKLGLGIAPNDMKGDYNLWVARGIMTERIKVAVSGTIDWSDKVFDKSYVLKPLDQVEKFINKNHHLPDVPSASQLVEDKGYDVQKMDATLLQKIEELTLYLLELKKENNELKKLITKK